MNILIEEVTRQARGTYVKATAGNVSASVAIYDDGAVWMLVNNASSRAGGRRFGYGKTWVSLDAELNNYRSNEARAILFAAASEAEKQLTPTTAP